MGEKGEGFTGTIIKDIWTTTRGRGRWGGLQWWGGVGDGWGKKAENYLNNNKKKFSHKIKILTK